MGAMKDFLLWCEENGHIEWSDRTDDYEWLTERSQSDLMEEYSQSGGFFRQENTDERTDA